MVMRRELEIDEPLSEDDKLLNKLISRVTLTNLSPSGLLCVPSEIDDCGEGDERISTRLGDAIQNTFGLNIVVLTAPYEWVDKVNYVPMNGWLASYVAYCFGQVVALVHPIARKVPTL